MFEAKKTNILIAKVDLIIKNHAFHWKTILSDKNTRAP